MAGNERRRSTARGLRQLFQNQLGHLHTLLVRRSAERKAARHRDLMEQGAVEAVVEGTNTLVRLASGYKSRMRESVRGLLQHVDELASQLPAPIDVGPGQFLRDPRVNAFFVNADAVRDTFSQSHELQAFFSDPMLTSQTHAYAVMFMQRVDKEVFGTVLVDGMMRQDERKTTVSFTNHRILEPRENEALVRDALERFLFSRVVDYVNHHLARMSRGGVGGPGAVPAQDGVRAEEPLNLKDPEVYLRQLIKALDSHRELLQIETSGVRVNRIGEMVEKHSEQVANNLDLLEIRLGHHNHEVVTLVRYPRDEMISQNELLRRAGARLTY